MSSAADISRRNFLVRSAAVSVCVALAACEKLGPYVKPVPVDFAIVDAHCHVFNAQDLPAAAFLDEVYIERYTGFFSARS